MISRADIVKNYIPSELAEADPIKSILDAEGKESGQLNEDISETLDQFYINKASWGLTSWECFLGIQYDPQKSDELRKSVIKAKLNRNDTFTKDFVKKLALSYENGDVDVIEQNDKYEFLIIYKSVKGIPPNFQDFINAVNELKPAHLNFDWQLNYITWDAFDSYDKTWDQWDALDLTANQLEVYSENGSQFNYITWDEFDNYKKGWDQWDMLNLSCKQLEIY